MRIGFRTEYYHTTIKITSEFGNLSVTLPMPRVTLLRRPARSGWLQGVVTGIGLQQHVNYVQSAQSDKPLDGSRGEAHSNNNKRRR